MATTTPTKPNFDTVWASIQELVASQKETDLKFKETDKQIKNVNQTLGAWASNQGRFAEEYFFNSFEKGQKNFFGEKFDRIGKNWKKETVGYEDEYDIVLINGKSIGIVEIKFKAHESDIPSVLRKAETFRANFPEYEKFKIYLGLASLAFYPELEEGCLRHGLAVIKQVGDAVVINDSCLRAY